MSVDVIHLVRRDPRVVERPAHRKDGARSFRMHVRDPESVRRIAITQHLSQNRRFSRPGVGEIFENQSARSFGHHEAISPSIKRPRSCLRLLIPLHKSG